MKLNYRLATILDYPIVADIYTEHILKRTATMILEPQTAEDIAEWVEKFNNRERLFVVEKSDQVIGWGIIKKYSPRQGYFRTCETSIYFYAAETGKGYGTDFQKFLMKTAKKLNYHHIVLKIFGTNEKSVRFHERLGFTLVGIQREVGFVEGKWIDGVIMQYIFDDKKEE